MNGLVGKTKDNGLKLYDFSIIFFLLFLQKIIKKSSDRPSDQCKFCSLARFLL